VIAVTSPTSTAVASIVAGMEVGLRFHNEDKTQEKFTSLHIKLMSHWGSCITTAVISEESTQWQYEEKEGEGDEEGEGKDSHAEDKKTDDSDDEETFPKENDNSQVAMWSKTLDGLHFDDKTFLDKFNSSPLLHAFLYGYEMNGLVKVLTYTCVDCSGLLLQGGAVSARSFNRHGMFLDLKVHSEKPLASTKTVMPLEPFVLNLDRYVSSVLLNCIYLFVQCLTLTIAISYLV
jgi:hypothetical protein